MRRILMIAVVFLLAGCGTSKLINTDEHRKNDLLKIEQRHAEISTDIKVTSDRILDVIDKSKMKITYYDTVGRKTAEIEIDNSIVTKDSTRTDASSSIVEKSDTVITSSDQSVIDTTIKEKPKISWWMKALMWTGIAAIIYLIIRIIIKIYIHK